MSVAKIAQGFIGKVKYKFGASTPQNGVSDCSGFTQYIFRENGLTIGRTTQEQYRSSEKVPLASIKPGDLIFFKNTYNSNYLDGVSHVGIFVGGDMMIDCGNDGATMRSFKTDYWTKHFLGVGRYAGANTTSLVDGGTSGLGNTGNNSTNRPSMGLAWYGDIVAVVLITLCVIGGVLFLIKSMEA